MVAGLWAVVFGFLVGVFLRSFISFGYGTILFLAFLSTIPLLVYAAAPPTYFRVEKFKRAGVVAVFFLALAGGALRMHGATVRGDSALDVWVGERVSLEGVVIDEPDVRENATRIPLRVTLVASTSVERDVRVIVIAPLHASVHYGDIVRVEGELELPEAFDSGLGRTFNYPAFLAKEGIGYQLSYAALENRGKGRTNPLKVAVLWIKRTYVEGLAIALPEPEAGLAAGITIGEKRGIGEELSNVFRAVGLIHIVVLSGYNIMIVISGIERLFGSASGALRSLLAGGVALLFVCMTGFASSSVRAASMALIAILGRATGRTYLASRALGVVALLMVLWNPLLLAFDPGFQLSIMATLGILFVAPIIERGLIAIPERLELRGTVAATLGTQIAVLPLILYSSGQVSIYSVPANVLTLVVVPFAMALAAVAGCIGIVAGALAPFMAFPAYVLLAYIIGVARFFADTPLSTIIIPSFSAAWVGVAYAIGICLVALYKKRRAPR